MSNLTRAMMMGAAGAASGDKVYVDDVFSATLYNGNSTNSGAATNQRPQSISNGIELGSFVGVSLNGKTITSINGTPDLSKLNNDIFSSPNTDYYYGTIDCYVDYGSAVVAKFFELAPQGDNKIGAVYNYPDSIISSGSNDATNWTQLAYINYDATDWIEGKFTKHTFQSNTTAYRYYRLDISGNKSVQEWRLGISDPKLGKGGLVWTKSRSNGSYHSLFDTERSLSNWIRSDSASVVTSNNIMNGFNSDGYTLGTDQTYQIINYLNREYVSWTFRKEPGFFDIITWSGDNNGDRYFNHNLDSIPGCVIVKRTSTSGSMSWGVYHRSLGTVQTQGLTLNENYASGNSNNVNPIRSTPTSTQIYVRGEYNTSGHTYVAYLFAHDDARFGTGGNESIIKCGVMDQGIGLYDIGFEPQFMLVKPAGSTGDWALFDDMRGFGLEGIQGARNLFPNTTAVESSVYGVDLTSTGFNNRSYSTSNNAIYMAIRRPNKPRETAREVFAIDGRRATNPGAIAGFPVDAYLRRQDMNSIGQTWFSSRVTDTAGTIDGTGNDFNTGPAYMDSSIGLYPYAQGSTSPHEYNWMFKRAPGFFDVVAYKGTGASGHNISHNLGVVPEFMIVKSRDGSPTYNRWYTQHTGQGDGYYMQLNDDGGAQAYQIWSSKTATTITLNGASPHVQNESGINYVAYLFATLPGISKVGTYSGDTGNDVDVDCGFENGVRFLLIKRKDTGADWYLYDSFRGITSGNDPYMRANLTAAEVTNTNYINPLPAGFTVNASAPAALNVDGGTYTFLAIA